MQTLKIRIVSLGFLSLCLALSACDKNDKPSKTKTENAAPAADLAEPVAAMAEPGGKALKIKIGIEDCDTFLEKYRACFDKLPKAMREKMQSGLEKTEQAWLEEAKDPAAHEGIRNSCKALDEATASAMKAQGCDWS